MFCREYAPKGPSGSVPRVKTVILPVDLHVHSCYSDGSYTPAQIVGEAQAQGLKGLSLTDHDSWQGLAEFMAAARQAGLAAVPGIEITTEYGGSHIHILGYGIDFRQEDRLKQSFSGQWQAYADKAVYALGRSGLARLFGLRPEDLFARIRAETGRADRLLFPLQIKEYVRKQPGLGARLKAVDWQPAISSEVRSFMSPWEAVRLVRELGGLAVLAHPGVYMRGPGLFQEESWQILLTIIASLQECGLSGLEIRHPSLNKAGRCFFNQVAVSRGLITTGGSDFHGRYRPGNHLGLGGITENKFELFKQVVAGESA